jgi:hypothetical protein
MYLVFEIVSRPTTSPSSGDEEKWGHEKTYFFHSGDAVISILSFPNTRIYLSRYGTNNRRDKNFSSGAFSGLNGRVSLFNGGSPLDRWI